MTHDPLCPACGADDRIDLGGGWGFSDPAPSCQCTLISKVRKDERQSIVSFMRDWIETDPVIQSFGPNDIWSYGYGVRYASSRIESLGGES